jgi:uncharacterized protein YbjT (DUF2867 family)
MIDAARDQPTLVLGGTGKTGRRIVERLRRRSVPVRIGSRSSRLPFDWNDPVTWRPVLEGVEAAYIAYAPDLGAPGATETVGAFVSEASAADVGRLVLLSGRGEREAQACEKLVMRSGAAWTILRSSWFSQNFSENYFLEPILAGRLALPVGDVGEPFTDADDIAVVAATVLTDDAHAERIYELTGPRLLTFADAVATIAAATGRAIRYERIPAEDFATLLRGDGVSSNDVEFLVHLFGTVLDGRNAYVTDGVQRVLGRPPRDFADYARATASTGVWDQGRAA